MRQAHDRTRSTTMKDIASICAAATLSPIAGIGWWMVIDDIAFDQAIATPIPYALIALSWFVATPIYLVLREWVNGKLWRFLFLATIGAMPAAAKAVLYFLTPRDIFAAFLIFSTAWVCAATYWAVLRRARFFDRTH